MTQKQTTLFSLLAVVACAVALNELIVSQSQEDQNRGVASFGERFEPQQIKWEQELAKAVSSSPQSKTLIAKKPSLQDRLLFEAFAGQYEAKIVDGRIKNIVLGRDKNPKSFSTKEFVETYGSLMATFEGYTVRTVGNKDIVELTRFKGEEAGVITIERDAKGRVVEIVSK